jgi:YD repeat-containing protein
MNSTHHYSHRDLIETARRISQGMSRLAVSFAEATERLAAAAQSIRRHSTPLDRFRMSGGEFILRIVLVSSFCLLPSAFATDKTVRDASGAIVERRSATSTGETVRDAAGAIVERRQATKNADGTVTVTVRDSSGNLIRRETVKK